MAIQKLMVKNGTYTNNQGEEKGRWIQVGVKGIKDGKEWISLDPTINLAGFDVEVRDGKKSVFVSVFDDKPKQSGGYSQGGQDSSEPPF